MEKTAGGARRLGHFEAPKTNRSLERGIEILRAFRPGTDLLGNGELAERAGLSNATVSRLTQTLVAGGLLEHDRARRAYRLAAPILSLAHAMNTGSPVLNAVRPLMRREAQARRINVGLAVADRDDMIYLESVRYHPRVSLRSVVAGQRVPIRLTSLGRAWLAAAPAGERAALMAQWRKRYRRGWRALEPDILDAVEHACAKGWCAAAWQPGVVAVASALVVPGHPVYVLNMSASGVRETRAQISRLAAMLMAFRPAVAEAIETIAPGA